MERVRLTYLQYIISSTKDEYVSTSFNTGCGGKSNGFIYEILIDDLHYVDWSEKVLGVKPPKIMPISPKLLLNADKLSDATIIAIDSNRDAKEVSFLTSIPQEKIMRFAKDSTSASNSLIFTDF